MKIRFLMLTASVVVVSLIASESLAQRGGRGARGTRREWRPRGRWGSALRQSVSVDEPTEQPVGKSTFRAESFFYRTATFRDATEHPVCKPTFSAESSFCRSATCDAELVQAGCLPVAQHTPGPPNRQSTPCPTGSR